VDELAEDGEGLGAGGAGGEGDGITDTEAHAEMGGALDDHKRSGAGALNGFRLCMTK
jgi:hypothetical protein